MPGCEKCSIEWNYDDPDEWNNGALGEVRIGKGEMLCNIIGPVGPSWHITPIEFCPFCGQRLAEDKRVTAFFKKFFKSKKAVVAGRELWDYGAGQYTT